MMSRLDAQKLADLVGSPFAAQLVAAMPEPAVIVSSDERAAAAREWQTFLRNGEYMGKRALVRADGSEVQVEFAARLEVLGGRRLAIYVAMVDDDPPPSPSSLSAGELPLTKREREVVTLIALGQDTAEIAKEGPQRTRRIFTG